MWQWLTLAAGVGSAVVLLLYMPFTYSGGGGPVGNRYFLGAYGVFLFLVPPLQTAVGGLVTMALSALFVAPILSNPFYASLHPAEHSKTGLFRWLPTELTMVNDLPVNVSPSRIAAAARRHAAGARRISSTTTSTTARAMRSGCEGESSADILLRAPIPTETDAAGVERARSLRIEKLTVHPRDRAASRIASTISTGGETPRRSTWRPSSQQTFELAMPHGLPYSPIRGFRPTTSTSCRSRRRPASSRCSRTARTTAASSA